jgi:hypothetical protein
VKTAKGTALKDITSLLKSIPTYQMMRQGNLKPQGKMVVTQQQNTTMRVRFQRLSQPRDGSRSRAIPRISRTRQREDRAEFQNFVEDQRLYQQANKLEKQLDKKKVQLLTNQADIVQLRMKIIEAMMKLRHEQTHLGVPMVANEIQPTKSETPRGRGRARQGPSSRITRSPAAVTERARYRPL